MLEAVQIQGEHSHRLGRRSAGRTARVVGMARQGPHHGFAETLPVGQAGQAVPVGQAADFGLLRRDVHAHVVKRARQIADLVHAAGVLQRHVVFAARQALRGRQQRTQGRGEPLRHQPGAHRKQQHTRHGDDGQQHLQLAVGGHHLVHRAQQQRMHLAAHAVERCGARQQGPLGGLQLARRTTAAQQQGLRIRRQGADRQGHRAPRGLDHQGHMHRQELPHFVGTRLVDAKTHQHPADDHRRAHGHHHKLVRHAVHHRNLAALRLLREAGHHLLQRGGKLFHAIGQADGAQGQVGAQQGRHGRADAAAVVLQHRLDGVFVPRVDR